MQLPIGLKKYDAFVRQWKGAINRGIEFEFDFPEWEAWWIKNLGHDWQEKRGRITGKFCMARKSDKGPYAIHNVECKLFEENCRDKKINGTSPRGVKHGLATITDEIAKEIFLSKGAIHATAKRLGVSPAVVHNVRVGKSWGHATKDLPPRRQRITAQRVTAEEVKAIYLHPGSIAEIRRTFHRSFQMVQSIKKRTQWRKFTKGLTAPPENKWGRLGGHALKGTTKA